MQPGLRAGVDPAAAVTPETTGSWLDFLKGLVPANPIGLVASTTLKGGLATTTVNFNVLQIIVAAVAIGAAAVRSGGAGAPFLAFNASALAVFRRVLRRGHRADADRVGRANRRRRRALRLGEAVSDQVHRLVSGAA